MSNLNQIVFVEFPANLNHDTFDFWYYNEMGYENAFIAVDGGIAVHRNQYNWFETKVLAAAEYAQESN